MPFPSPPWRLDAQLWLSVFVLLRPSAGRPAGVYGVAFVDYEDTGDLAYSELLVARLVRAGPVPRVTITDIWVDSVVSRDGGRSLWAIPKELADLPLVRRSAGLLERVRVGARRDGRPFATGTFTALRGLGPVRTPYAGTVAQQRPDGSPVVTPMRGSARLVPCRGSWDLAADGPLGFLAGRRPVLSLRLRDARVRFG